jgi:hypothetical protein
MNRRSFLGAILASAMAPAIVRASSLMQLPVRQVWTHPLGGEIVTMEGMRFHGDWGTLKFYDGEPGDPLANLLGEMPIENWQPAEFGSIEASTPGILTWARSGVASMFAIERASDGQRVITGNVGDPRHPADFNFDQRQVAAGSMLGLNGPPRFTLGDGGSLGGVQLSTEVRNRMLDAAIGLPETVRKP